MTARAGAPLPPGWRWLRLGEVTEVVNGTTPDSTDPNNWQGDIVWVTPTDLGKLSGRYIQGSDRRITRAGFDSRNLTLVPPGSIVLSSRAPIGYVGIAAISLCTNQGCKSFVLGANADSGFMYYALLRATPELQELGSGATFAEVSKSQLERFEVPLPPLPEQRRIAAILNAQMDAVARARKAAEERLAAVNALPAAYLREVFPAPGQALPAGWGWIPFGEITHNHDGTRIPVKQADRKAGRYPYYGASGIIDYVDQYLFDGDYLLIAEDGANLVARSTPIAFRASGKFWVNNHAHVVKPRPDTSLDYLIHYFEVADISAYVKGAAQPKLNQNDLNAISVPFPALAEQCRMAATLNAQMDAVARARKAAEDELATINALPAALLRRAFNGEV